MFGIVNDISISEIIPEGFELINGDLTLSQNPLPYGNTDVMNAQIKAVKLGNWTITARLKAAVKNFGLPDGGAEYPIYISVGEAPPWYTKTWSRKFQM